MEVELKSEEGARTGLPGYLLLVVVAATTLCILMRLLVRCRYGIDLSDEGYHLVFIADPWSYEVGTTQFAHVYYPLFRLVGGDVVLLRQINTLATFATAWLLCGTLLNSAAPAIVQFSKRDRWFVRVVSAALATGSLVMLEFWCPTPNYNSLSLQSLMIAGIALLRIGKDGVPVGNWILLGFAGWLTFAAKPTTAAALAMVVSVYLGAMGTWHLRRAWIAAGTAVILLIAWTYVVDDDPLTFTRHVRESMETTVLLAAGHGTRMFRFDVFRLTPWEAVCFPLVTATVTALIWSGMTYRPRVRIVAIAAVYVFSAQTIATACGYFPSSLQLTAHQGLLLGAVALGIAGAAVLSQVQGYSLKIPPRRWVLALCWGVLPHVYAFGSGHNYWRIGAAAGIFWVLAGVTLLIPSMPWTQGRRALLPIIAVTQLAVALILYVSQLYPYRQPPRLYENGNPYEMNDAAQTLLLSRECADYFTAAESLAKQSGLTPNTPVIDLSGQSPGLLFALRAKSVGYPWLIGGYPGSDRWAAAMLDRVPRAEIAAAWILLEPKGERAISTSILNRYDIQLEHDYMVVGKLHTPPYAGDYVESREQILLKPRRSRP